MKTKQKWLFALPAALAMLFVSCDINGLYKTIDYKLHGTWESTNVDPYSGKLVIDSDTITIIGYEEWQTPWYGDDARHPFKNFAKNAPLPCYSKDEKLFIMTVEGEKIVSYLYSSSDQGKFLFFAFGGRDEALKRTGN
jgi:hypothetical protein